MKYIFSLFVLFTNVGLIGQTESFNSRIEFSEGQLSNFISSFSIDTTQIYFNANDYTVYAFDKETGALKWSHYVANKSNNAPKFYKENVFIKKHISEYLDRCIQLNAKTGDTIQTLSIQSINTEPIFKNDIMYGTAIDDETGGIVMAYDLKKNRIIWKKFIAHGVDTKPYYLKDKIIANAEDDNWFELKYSGQLLDTTCRKKSNLFVDDIPCVRKFKNLTHNQKEISSEFFEDYELISVKYTKERTIVMGESKMIIINNKNKVEKEILLEEIIAIPENPVSNYTEILKVDGTAIWLISHNVLSVYDFISNTTLQSFDLTKWNPHQAILENNKLWLISRDNGQLVGVDLGK